jgi:CBS domain-containing protein
MPIAPEELLRFLGGVHPYDALDADALEGLVPQFVQRRLPAGEPI